MTTVRDFYDKINQIAPFKVAAQWDNTGLLIGDMNAPVKKALIALDITEQITKYAIKQKVNLIVTHHPLIFRPMKNITQKNILALIENKIAVIAAHTNIDHALSGVNYTLAQKIGLQNIKPLTMLTELTQYQIATYVPPNHAKHLIAEMHKAGAGNIGEYSQCATYYDTNGQYMPSEQSEPYRGTKNKLEQTKETKIEMICDETNINQVTNAMMKNHPYQTPAYTIIPLHQKSQNYALGCHGNIPESIVLKDLAKHIKKTLNAPFVKLWLADKKKNTPIKNVAVCGGSGNSIIQEAKKVADVFVTADMTYHFLLDANIPVIDPGHFYSENHITETLKDWLKDIQAQTIILPPNQHDIKKLSIV